jgi:hypothetical protein
VFVEFVAADEFTGRRDDDDDDDDDELLKL